MIRSVWYQKRTLVACQNPNWIERFHFFHSLFFSSPTAICDTSSCCNLGKLHGGSVKQNIVSKLKLLFLCSDFRYCTTCLLLVAHQFFIFSSINECFASPCSTLLVVDICTGLIITNEIIKWGWCTFLLFKCAPSAYETNWHRYLILPFPLTFCCSFLCRPLAGRVGLPNERLGAGVRIFNGSSNNTRRSGHDHRRHRSRDVWQRLGWYPLSPSAHEMWFLLFSILLHAFVLWPHPVTGKNERVYSLFGAEMHLLCTTLCTYTCTDRSFIWPNPFYRCVSEVHTWAVTCLYYFVSNTHYYSCGRITKPRVLFLHCSRIDSN